MSDVANDTVGDGVGDFGARGRLARWLDTPIVVTDDAGREFEFVQGGGSYDAEDPVESGESPTQAGAEHARSFGAWARSMARYVLVALVLIAVLSLAVGMIWRVGTRIGAALGMTQWVAGPFALSLVFGWMYFGSHLERLAPFGKKEIRAKARGDSIMRVRRGRCGACAFELDDSRANPHGLVTCPECDARWLLEAWRRDWVEHPRLEHEWKHPRRGRRWKLLDTRDVALPSLAGHPASEARKGLGAIRNGLWWSLSRTDFWALAVWAAGSAMLCSVVLLYLPGQAGPKVLMILGIFSALVLVAILVQRIGRIRHAANAAFIDAHVRRGVCPCCEHELDPEPARSDGALLCRRCGGAWKPVK